MNSAQTKPILDYHKASKHGLNHQAWGPGRLDWANQPDPFRRYAGCQLLPLAQPEITDRPLYDQVYQADVIEPSPLNALSLAQLFYDSLSLSAWKCLADSRWALRVNPSSGNLHPTEAYVICGPIEQLWKNPMVAHYAPEHHQLELRAELSARLWQQLSIDLPKGTVLVALTSIHWREAWKYGQRAYRYCQHDTGHALAGLRLAAAALGWKALILDRLSSKQLALLTGVFSLADVEPETPTVLLAIAPTIPNRLELPDQAIAEFTNLNWHGQANLLSTTQLDWGMTAITQACTKPNTPQYKVDKLTSKQTELTSRPISFRQIIRQRRSAVAMDGETWLPVTSFYRMLEKTLAAYTPFDLFPWQANCHLIIFVHKVSGLKPGLYLLVRNSREKNALQLAITQAEHWYKPDNCPARLELYCLMERDTREATRQVSCFQDIASQGCFSLAVISHFQQPLEQYGCWFYPRLFWEAGAIGQVLYLEAEAAGIRATGIGCYFDDPVHEILGLKDSRYQDLYHFTMGGTVEDSRLTTLPAYP